MNVWIRLIQELSLSWMVSDKLLSVSKIQSGTLGALTIRHFQYLATMVKE